MRKTMLLLLAILSASAAWAQAQDGMLGTARRVNNYFVSQNPDPTKPTFVRRERSSNLWTRAVYYEGLMDLYSIDPDPAYIDYTDRWAAFHKWTARSGADNTNADNQCCEQTYLDRFAMTGDSLMIAPTTHNLDHQMATRRVDYWWWIDAIQMAMPIYAKYAKITGNRTYLDYAMRCYRDTRDRRGLFNRAEGFWWRDSVYKAPYKEPDGKNCYWSRGNGWVYAALVRVMKTLNPSDPYYKELEGDFITMSRALVKIQRADGYWNASLVSTNYAGPEMTGTGLFLYGMAWGIRTGILPEKEYRTACDKAWKALANCVHDNGFLGYNQGTGADPSTGQPVTFTSVPDFEDYGTGCWLLGMVEYYKLNDKRPYQAGTRWWWLGSAVDSTNLAWNLEQLHNHGIGTVEITPLYGVQGNEKNDLRFLSPEWMHAIRTTEDIAARDSIEVDMNNGTGWPFGGPWITIDEAACKAVFVDTIVGKDANAADIKFAVPEKEVATSKLYGVREFPAADKTKKRIIALYVGRTRQKVKRAAPGGEGYVIDHFDARAVSDYLAHIDSAFEASHTPYPAVFFNDSYEVYKADWTPLLPEEFEKRRGYSLMDNIDKLVDGDPQVVSDYRETLSDLIYENFTLQWTRWAHSHGVKVRNQAHGSPANLLDLYGAVDIPEIEGFGLSDFGIKGLRTDSGFTRKNYSDVSMLKYAPSAAHVMGKPLTSSETFTWLTEHFRTSLSQMKPDLDLMFSCGVNRMFFHGTCYSPKDDPWPGWKFYASIDMSPTNSIWRDAPFLMQYIERCQRLLQWGEPDNDFLVSLPVREMWKKDTKHRLMLFDINSMARKAPEFIRSVLEIDSLGYGTDYISDRQMKNLKRLPASVYGNQTDGSDYYVTEGGTVYKGLIDPTKPIDANELASKAKPEELRTKLHLRYIRRSNPSGWHYFIANLTPDDVDGYAELSVPMKDAVWYNAITDEYSKAAINYGKVRVNLLSGESRFLLVSDGREMALPDKTINDPAVFHRDAPSKTIDTPWKLSFISSAPEVGRTWTLAHPQTWETLDDDSVKVTMGTGVYTTTVSLTKAEAQKQWAIDLGDVRESARVYINGQFIGCAWAVPFVLNTRGTLHKGKNEIRIEVTNLPANRIADYDRRGVKWRKMKEINIVNINYKKSSYAGWAPVKSGLNSPVRLVEY